MPHEQYIGAALFQFKHTLQFFPLLLNSVILQVHEASKVEKKKKYDAKKLHRKFVFNFSSNFSFSFTAPKALQGYRNNTNMNSLFEEVPAL